MTRDLRPVAEVAAIARPGDYITTWGGTRFHIAHPLRRTTPEQARQAAPGWVIDLGSGPSHVITDDADVHHEYGHIDPADAYQI